MSAGSLQGGDRTAALNNELTVRQGDGMLDRAAVHHGTAGNGESGFRTLRKCLHLAGIG